jgi:hypothetical protein
VKKVVLDDPGGVGEEIVSEMIVCPQCGSQLRSS